MLNVWLVFVPRGFTTSVKFTPVHPHRRHAGFKGDFPKC